MITTHGRWEKEEYGIEIPLLSAFFSSCLCAFLRVRKLEKKMGENAIYCNKNETYISKEN